MLKIFFKDSIPHYLYYDLKFSNYYLTFACNFDLNRFDMKFSKVKIGKVPYSFYRDRKKGVLLRGEDINCQSKNLLMKYRGSHFDMSIIDITLAKEIPGRKNRNTYVESIINNIVKNNKQSYCPKLTPDEVRNSLNAKFRNKIKYYPDNTIEYKEFSLVDLICEYSLTNDIEVLKPYLDWSKWYLNRKLKYFFKSVAHNKIDLSYLISDTQSKRKRVLISLYNLGMEKRKIVYYEKLEKTYDFPTLCNRFEVIITNCDIKNQLSSNIQIKNALQEHQKTIFGTRENPLNRNDDYLAIYNNEIVKYFERYFPVKRTKRRYSLNLMKHYLSSQTIISTIRRQFENSIRVYIMQVKRIKIHNVKLKRLNSSTLGRIKLNDDFISNIQIISAFATSNLRNIFNLSFYADFYDANMFIQLNLKNINKDIFKMYFDEDFNSNNSTYLALRSSLIFQENSILPYYSDIIKELFDKEFFTYPDNYKDDNNGKNLFYKDTIFKDYLEKDIDLTPKYFADILKNKGITSYYSIEDLISIFSNHKLSLNAEIKAFAPSFERIFNSGCNYQTKTHDKHFLNITNYYPKDYLNQETKEEFSARYSLLKFIYEYLFLHDFNDIRLMNVSKYIIDKNSQYAEEKHKADKYAYKSMKIMTEKQSVMMYLSNIKKMIENENIIKNHNYSYYNKGNKNYSEKFLIDIFVKAFDVFLNQFSKHIIHKTHKQTPKNTINLNIKETSINPNNSSHIRFYIFVKLLDEYNLNKLRNEIIKYKNLKILTEIIDKSYKIDERLKTDYLIEITELCLLKLRSQRKIEFNYIENWIDIKLLNYTNIDNYDKIDTQKIKSNLYYIKKYSTEKIFDFLFNQYPQYKVSYSDIIKYKEYLHNEENGHRIIDNIYYTKYNIHKSWVHKTFKAYDITEDELIFNPHSLEYKNLIHQLQEFDSLERKIHLTHLKESSQLLNEIFQKLIRYITILDRDKEYLKGEILNYNTSHFNQQIHYIRHLNYYFDKDFKYSIIDLINYTREIMTYNRAIKNSVYKSIIKIFEDNGMELKMTHNIETYKLEIQYIRPKRIYHLKTTPRKGNIYEYMVSQEYCDFCRTLMEMKS
ncbi:MAG: type VI-A CRISPR-associated RNA-guided ribonuclease Cas13a [Bacteroidales bacterium]|jgi:hypothetical protein|nr:type VI-A CRISPR-associated RNA-guided ribonuclease Cas13a [Bacteroidales bacterium]